MVWLNDSRRLAVGDVVCIDAVDWAMYNEQVSPDGEFKVVRGLIYGMVVKHVSKGDGVLIAPQVFEEGDIRCALAIPHSAIKSIRILATKEDMQRGEYDPIAAPVNDR